MEASALTHAHRGGLLGRRSPLLKLQSDERLVALIRQRNEHAFEVLFERYHSRLLAFCRHMLRSQEDAEDVLQEVFVKAHAAMLADERHIHARPWLYRIARNRCLNHLRRPVPEGQDTMDVMPADGGVTTADRVQKREEFRALVDDVGELPETQRTALLLRELNAMSYEEIASAMDTTIPAVKSLLVRARMSLAEATQSRHLTCGEVRLELAEAAEGLRRASGPVRHHLRRCEPCREYRGELRENSKALAALAPIAPLLVLHHFLTAKLPALLTGSGSGVGGAAGGAAVGGAGVAATGTGVAAAGGTAVAGAGAAAASGAGAVAAAAAGAGGIGGAIGAKAAATAATAALITAGAVEVRDRIGAGQRDGSDTPPPARSVAPEQVAGHAADRDAKLVATAATVISEPEPAAPAPADEPAPAPLEAVAAPPAEPLDEDDEAAVGPSAGGTGTSEEEIEATGSGTAGEEDGTDATPLPPTTTPTKPPPTTGPAPPTPPPTIPPPTTTPPPIYP